MASNLCSAGMHLVQRNTFWEVHDDSASQELCTLESRVRAYSDAVVDYSKVDFAGFPRKSFDDQSTCSTHESSSECGSSKEDSSFEEDVSDTAMSRESSLSDEDIMVSHSAPVFSWGSPSWINIPMMAVPAMDLQRHNARSRPSPEQAYTTIILRNLPNDFKRSSLLDVLNSEGFFGLYDFVYMPTDFRKWLSFGFAFVNFVTHTVADSALRHFDQFCIEGTECVSGWSENLQGLEPHVDRYRNSPVMHHSVPDEYKPVLFMHGAPVSMPHSTKRIPRPRTGGRSPQFAKNFQ